MEEEESTAVLMERKLKILHQKNEERKLRVEKRKELKTKDSIAEENINSILIKFEQLNDEILSVLNQIEDINVPKESLPELFDSCYCKLEEWQKMISLTSHIMKIYHKKHLQDKYHELNDRRVKLEQSLLPEKKFSFRKLQKKDTKNETGDKEPGVKAMVDEVDAALCKAPKKFVYKFEDEFGLSGKADESSSYSHEQLSKKDAVFKDLKNCRLTLEGGANTTHFVSLVDCRVLCGPVSTSIFVEKCSDCTFVVACQQLRVHSTSDCDFYSHVTSRAIIEDCKRVRFAPFNWKYEGIEEHFKSVNLNVNENNWSLVNDFNWLSSVPSPNWKVIEEDDRVVEWN